MDAPALRRHLFRCRAWGVWQTGWAFKPRSPRGCRREGQAAGSPPRTARAADKSCGSLGGREMVSTSASPSGDSLLSAAQGTHLWPRGLC